MVPGWQEVRPLGRLPRRGIQVDLYEMRPVKMTPAHHTSQLAELVCSNSFRADQLTNAVGVLKEEMRRLDSLIMKAADQSRVPRALPWPSIGNNLPATSPKPSSSIL